MQKITTFLMFNDRAEEAVNLYVSVFKGAKIGAISRGHEGKATGINFELFGQQYAAYNGGPHFRFTEGISLMVACETQEEVDTYWEKLTANGGKPSQCGWLTDPFGVSWQITPTALMRMINDKNPKKAKAAVDAMLKMAKIDIAALQRAYDQA